MSSKVGLRIGESFAEIRAFPTPFRPAAFQTRWYRPKRSITDVLKEAANALAPAERATGIISITSSRHENALERRQGSAPALLVTSGFETWLAERKPLISPIFSNEPQRGWLPLETDRIFGMSERVRADGAVEKGLALEDLEFLAAKLELLRVKQIAIALLNSHVNPEHEKQAEAFFRERGYSVFSSHSFSADSNAASEVARWRLALETAFAAPAIEEERREILSAIDEALGADRAGWTVELLGASGVQDFTTASASEFRRGFTQSLARYFEPRRERLGLHLGLETFTLYKKKNGLLIERPLPLQPTQSISQQGWSIPTYAAGDRGYEPGPMLFGRSHQLALIDVLFARENLATIEGFTPLVAERSKARIIETLFTLGKSLSTGSSGTIDARDIAADLELSAIERLAAEIACADTHGEAADGVLLTGALATSLEPLLKKRRPDLKFIKPADGEWLEADACLSGGLQ